MKKLWGLFKQNLFMDFSGWRNSVTATWVLRIAPTNTQTSRAPPQRIPWSATRTTAQVQPLSLQVTRIYDPVAHFVFKKHNINILAQLWCGTLQGVRIATKRECSSMLMRVSSCCMTLSIPMWPAVSWISCNACNGRCKTKLQTTQTFDHVTCTCFAPSRYHYRAVDSGWMKNWRPQWRIASPPTRNILNSLYNSAQNIPWTGFISMSLIYSIRFLKVEVNVHTNVII